jgi:predicted RND superfamily exporter protein
MPAEQQRAVVEDLRAQLDPPPGVTAEVAGQPVLEAETYDEIESSRWLSPLLALAAVFTLLVALYRRLEPALLVAATLAVAVGAAWVFVFVSRTPVNPLSSALGAVVVAIAAPLAAALAGSYRNERARGSEARAAAAGAYGVARSAYIAPAAGVAGLATLYFSGIDMLHDFSVSSVGAVAVAAATVGIVMPAALVAAERRRGPLRVPRSRAEVAARAPGAAKRMVAAGRRRLRADPTSRE